MKPFTIGWIWVLVAIVLAGDGVGVARASVVPEAGSRFSEQSLLLQPPTGGGGPASDTEFFNPFVPIPQVVWEFNADNLMLEYSASITAIRWWGFYGGPGQSHDPPPGDESFRVRFYGARSDSLPDDNSIILEQILLNPSRQATGQIVFAEVDAPEFLFQIDLPTPVTLAADTLHWLEIVQVGDVDSTFRWESGFGDATGSAFNNGIVNDWTPIQSNLAFQLFVPEPATAVLLAFGLLMAGMTRSRKARRREPHEDHAV